MLIIGAFISLLFLDFGRLWGTILTYWNFCIPGEQFFLLQMLQIVAFWVVGQFVWEKENTKEKGKGLLMFFQSISTSWEYAKESYRILLRNKRLMVFPVLTAIAAVLVSLSFVLPMLGSDGNSSMMAALDEDSEATMTAGQYVMLFLFYFFNYFVIVFFNSALIASTMQALDGRQASLGYGLTAAAKRLPQIVGWSLLSALVGVVLRSLERNKTVGSIITGILGMAWSALTYFVIPFLVVDGVGPVEAVKRSTEVLKKTWGTALLGNFSLSLLGFLLMVPVLLVVIVLFVLAGGSASPAISGFLLGLAVVVILVGAAATATVDTIFKALLFRYATGKSLPMGVNTDSFDYAFTSKR